MEKAKRRPTYLGDKMGEILNGNKWKVIGWIVGLVFAAGGVAVVVQNTQSYTQDNRKEIGKTNDKVDTVCDDVIKLQMDMNYIKKKVDETYEVQQKVLQKVTLLSGEPVK